MSSLALRLPRAFAEPGSRLIAAAAKVLCALIAEPAHVFIAALCSMLFRPPDLKAFPIDRMALGVLVATCALRLCVTRDRLRLRSASWPMLASAALAGWTLMWQPYHPEAWSVFAAKWIVPVALFHLAAIAFDDDRSLRKLECFCLCALGYLTFVSLCSLLDLRGLIFPRFILDERIGIHADRARGPFLQAVANGVCINILALVGIHSYERGRLRGIWAVMLLAGVPLALLATRTRAVWLSAALSVSWLALFRPTPHARKIAALLAGLLLTGTAVTLLYDRDWAQLNERFQERSPVDFRAEMYAAGWQMFTERPFAGWGGDDQIQPEVAKRVTGFHADYYVFHNTYLEIAVERGLIGLAAYGWLMACLFRLGRWKSPRDHGSSRFLGDAFCRLWTLLLCVYLVNASAVVMNYQFVNGLVFTFAGILAAQQCRAAVLAPEPNQLYENRLSVE